MALALVAYVLYTPQGISSGLNSVLATAGNLRIGDQLGMMEYAFHLSRRYVLVHLLQGINICCRVTL